MRLSLCPALLVLAAGCTSAAKPEPVWIGHLAPLSGRDRDRGEEAVRAIESALTQAREDGFSVNGRPVGVRHVDSAAEGARADATRLLAVNQVSALIVGPGATNVEDLLAAARSHGAAVVVLDEVARPPDFAGVFLLGPDPARRGAELAKQARERLKLSKVLLIVDPTCPLCVSLADAFARSWRDGGGTLRRRELGVSAEPNGEEGKSALEALCLAVPAERLAKPDERLAEAAAGRTLLYGGPDLDEIPLGRETAGKKPGKLHAVTAFPGAKELPEAGQQLFAPLEKADGPPPGRDAAFALDGIRFVLQGLKNGRSARRDLLREALGKIARFESVTGEMTWEEGRPVRPLFFREGEK